MTAPAPNEAAVLREALPYVLMKRGLYWRPNGQGYTGVLADAGRYTEEDARGHHDHDAGGTAMHLASECPEFSPACWPETQIKVMRAERDAALARATTTDADLAKARGEIETSRIENDQLRRALEEAHRGLRMIHDGLADPTRPRQSVGEVAAYWVAEIGSHLAGGGPDVGA